MRLVDATAGETELGEPDVILDALFGTGFSGEPRPDAAALIERINDVGRARASRSTSRPASTRRPARSRERPYAPTRP